MGTSSSTPEGNSCQGTVSPIVGLEGLDADNSVLAAVLGALTSHLALLDSTGRIVLTNAAWAAFARDNGGGQCATSLGVNYLELCERASDDSTVGTYARSMADAIRGAMGGRDDPIVVEYPCDSPTEKRWYEATVRRIELGAQVYVSVLHHNVTSLRTIIEQLRVARLAAESADRAKSEFLANMSHELRTPMTAILGYAGLLAERGDRAKAPKDRLEAVDTIQRNGQQLVALINDILDLSRIESGRLVVSNTRVDLRALLCGIVDTLAPEGERRGLGLRLEAGGDLPAAISADPVRVRQVLLALGSNAVKFTHEGHVTIRVDATRTEGGAATLSIAVRDTGIGLAPELRDNLFGTFQQGDGSMTRRYGGVGMGLRIASSLAEVMGGRIDVESQPGQGSVFTLVLPLLDADWTGTIRVGPITPKPDAGAAELALRPSGRLDGLRIFLVEDGLDNQRLLCILLRKAGAAVTTLDNGALAWSALAPEGRLAEPPPCDLIVSDMQMPEMDGYELARRLRAAGSSLPIIALTAHGMVGDEQKCREAGCDAYATKPIDRHRLIDLCRHWSTPKPDARDGDWPRRAAA